jgi:Uma2 family endonuclease
MTTTTKLTLDEFLCRPETKPASEYVDGEVIQKPMPKRKHAFLQIFLGRLLDEFLEATDLGRAGTEWRCVFGPAGRERAYVPDIMLVLRDRLTEDDIYLGPPDLAVDILSPGQPAGEFADKLLFYLMNGVRVVWVIDPERRTIAVYRPGREPARLTREDMLDGDDLLPGFSVPVERIFARIAGL